MTAPHEATTTTTTKGTSQLLTTSGCLKGDTGGTTDDSTGREGHATGSRALPGRSISRDLFVGSTASTTAEDDFQAGFRKLDHDAKSVASAAVVVPAGEGCNQSQSIAAASAAAAQSERPAAVGSFTDDAVSSSSAGRGDIARRSYERIENESKCKPFSVIGLFLCFL